MDKDLAKKPAKVSKKESAAASKALAKEQKRKKQEQKALKKEKKKSSKQKKAEGGNGQKGEDDDDMDDEEFEKLVAELLARDVEHHQVTIEKIPCDPECRASFSMCLAGNNPQEGCVIFGGEFFDGATSRCFDDVLRFRILANSTLEWKRITSPNSPPPRCAHASCTTPTHVYVFGGEFSTAWRFHHYNDLWRLDLKTNQWTNMPSVNGPSPRSGARMVAWKNFLVVFGGFYEASRGVRWHDDLFFYDLRTEKWSRAKFAATSQQPSPRSGFQFAPHPSKPIIFLYGGYSKVAASASAQKGRAMDDMWLLHLTIPTGKSAAFPECKWEFLPKKGAAPSKRSGASSCVHKNRLILFGGVNDTETQNDVVGTFYNSLFAFDMDRLRWYELNLRTASKSSGKKSRRNKKDSASVATSQQDDDVDEAEGHELSEDQDVEEDDDNADDDGTMAAYGLRDDAFYVIIDGKFVMVTEDDDEEDAPATVEGTSKASVKEPKQDNPANKVSSTTKPVSVDSQERAIAPDEESVTVSTTSETRQLKQQDAASIASKQELWNGQPAPEPRISAGLCLLGTRLLVYGGTAEIGDVQITFDDLWAIDLNKMDSWQQLLTGKWRQQQWAGKDEDEDEDGDDDDEDEEGSGNEEQDEEAEEDDSDATEDEEAEDDENENNVRALAEEIRALRDELGVDQEFNTPSPGESMKDFFARTIQFWLEEVAKSRQGDQERLSGKELRRLAFKAARRRFDLLYPLLEKLNALQEAQRLAEEEAAEEARAITEKLARRNAKKALQKKKG